MKIFVLFNHELTNEQKTDIQSMGIDEIIIPSEKVTSYWKNIKPSGEIDTDFLKEISVDIDRRLNKGDYILIQGEFGNTFYMVEFAFSRGFIPVYATTTRQYEETKFHDGSILTGHVFRHVSFRKYIRFSTNSDGGPVI
ncbi:MAG: hypothetical protein JXR95_02285 [Deltaproteobacteria bacterium]|nr:hypothetical protein [Deltaproteobacteria bacterium]